MLEILKVLADEARLRILRAVDQAELSVAELVEALNMPQSTVSRHLKPLKQIELVQSRREGTSVYYTRGLLFSDPDFQPLLQNRLKDLPEAHSDAAKIDHVLDVRRRKRLRFFDEVAGQYESLSEPGGGLDALSTALAAGFSNQVVADLGCGEGSLSLMLSRFAREVTCLDQSQKMLNLVEERAKEIGTNERLTFHKMDLEAINLEAGYYDAIFISQSLHHVSRPKEVIQRATTGLKTGGRIIILDLLKHDHEWTREQWADQWLGFMPEELSEWLVKAGLDIVRIEILKGFVPDLSVLMAVGVKSI
jgi:ArsR family transcriptional regulator